jgi:phytoene/squalene synthetase
MEACNNPITAVRQIFEGKMVELLDSSKSQAAAITKTASKQTYYTIRLFVDRDRMDDAFRAYGYFRWVDDVLDAHTGSQSEKIAFIGRQRDLLEALYRGEVPQHLCSQEEMLLDLVRDDTKNEPGLRSYLHHMMAVMEFDAGRRGRVISQIELSEYTRALATAVTDALYYFIGHDEPAPNHEARYLSVRAAHIVHMLRDALEDAHNGYFNIPHEYLQEHEITPWDVDSRAYRKWVCQRVHLARQYFKQGGQCLAQVKNLRCRLAGFAYTARFEWMLRAIERDNYCLRSEYPERKSLPAGLWMGWSSLASMITSPLMKVKPRKLASQLVRIED